MIFFKQNLIKLIHLAMTIDLQLWKFIIIIQTKPFLRKKKIYMVIVISTVIIFAVCLGSYFAFSGHSSDTTSNSKRFAAYPHVGGVVTNGHECAPIGSSILQKGGSAVDAAIAALFCEGVAVPQCMGLGGGFLMTIYIRKSKTAITLNARETAPAAATEDMFHGHTNLSSKGGLSVAVPGELRGYWKVYKKYGKLPWADLVKPTIELCRKGHLITPYLATTFKRLESEIRENPGLSEIFINPVTNDIYKKGDYLKREKFAETLEIIAKHGADALYDGVLTQNFVDDIKKQNGILTIEDMKHYKPLWREPISTKLPNFLTLYTCPLPGSGVILTFILNILSDFLEQDNINTVKNWHRIVESFKYGYAKRTALGDPKFVKGIESLVASLTSRSYAEAIRKNISDTRTFLDPKHYGANVTQVEDHGTGHVSVLAPNGDAVAVTSTINTYFGAKITSPSTGIILNDEMDDFSAPNITNAYGLPPSPANYIRPGKRPMSSMCPSIIVDENGDVVLVIGAAGGTKITTSVTLVTIRNLWYGESVKTAVSSSRLYHQLFPMEINFDNDFNEDIVKGLAALGHGIHVGEGGAFINGFIAVTAIGKRAGFVEGSADPRRGGQFVLIKEV